MALNKSALIRYKTIDYCLSNRGRKWTLEDLIEKVGDALYEYEGIRTGVSKRTIQADLQTMRSDKLGYNAPIMVVDKKYYTYEDPKFSITKSKLTPADISKMHEVVSILKQLNGFAHFDEMGELISKLESNIYRNKNAGKNYIQFESNKLLKGLSFLNPLYQCVIKKIPILLSYKSFKAKTEQEYIYYPYLLKEYRNRWFLLCKRKNHKWLMTLALDRIIGFQELPNEPFIDSEQIDFEQYYKDVIGVTKTENSRTHRVILQFNRMTAPYILTKPLHDSQTILKEDENSLIIYIEVVLNFELERVILGFGGNVKVLSPRILANKIESEHTFAANLYRKEKE